MFIGIPELVHGDWRADDQFAGSSHAQLECLSERWAFDYEWPGLAKRYRRGYDVGMTKAKIAISLPKEQLVRVKRKVRAGRADSVSGYITRVLEEEERSESLDALLQDLIGEYGEPSARDKKWAERALAPRRG